MSRWRVNTSEPVGHTRPDAAQSGLLVTHSPSAPAGGSAIASFETNMRERAAATTKLTLEFTAAFHSPAGIPQLMETFEGHIAGQATTLSSPCRDQRAVRTWVQSDRNPDRFRMVGHSDIGPKTPVEITSRTRQYVIEVADDATQRADAPCLHLTNRLGRDAVKSPLSCLPIRPTSNPRTSREHPHTRWRLIEKYRL